MYRGGSARGTWPLGSNQVDEDTILVRENLRSQLVRSLGALYADFASHPSSESEDMGAMDGADEERTTDDTDGTDGKGSGAHERSG
jgi:hypothetical protein